MVAGLYRSLVRVVLRTGNQLPLERLWFCSKSLRAEYVAACKVGAGAPVVPLGVPTNLFRPLQRQHRGPDRSRLRVLYCGRISPEKGIETLVRAFIGARARLEPGGISLTILGAESSPSYAGRLRQLLAEAGAAQDAEFLPRVPREHLPEIYAAHDLSGLPIRVAPAVRSDPRRGHGERTLRHSVGRRRSSRDRG